ncbi:MAG: 2,3-bisphosphoglycerate-independent phosphoglycerate mutase [Pyrinomonadaceae bacterium]
MTSQYTKRPLALVILDGWGYAPRTEGNAIAIAHTPYYDEITSKYPMTTLVAAGAEVGQPEDAVGNPEVGHLNIGTGRAARTELAKIREAIASGSFAENAVLDRAFSKARTSDAAVHLIGLLSDGGVHSSLESLFALLRLAKQHELKNVFIHCILDGLDVQPRTADIYVEALEIKLVEIGVGRIATLCGRYFAMDAAENWERTARAFTMLVHAEGERSSDAVTSIRNSFLRGISDEFIAPIIVEQAPDAPVATVKNGDLLLFFNHRPETMRQLVRSLCVPDGETNAKPEVETVCLTEYDRAFNLPAAFRQEPEKNTLVEVLSQLQIPNIKITEAARLPHLTYFFNGGADDLQQFEEQVVLKTASNANLHPESQSFKIVDRFCHDIEKTPDGVFVVNLPAAELMAETGDLKRTIAAIRCVDTCLGGILEAVQARGGVVLVTSSHGNCEEMVNADGGEPSASPTANRVPFHLIDDHERQLKLSGNGALADIAPTILGILGIDKPAEMTGNDLRIL